MDNGAVDPFTTPAGAPPPGVLPDFDSPGMFRDAAFGTAITATGVAVIMVAIRVFTKIYIMRKFNYEDYVLVLALMGSVTWDCVSLNRYTRGGKHIWDTPLADMPGWFFWINLLAILWHPAIIFSKWAILIQIRRVFAFNRYTPIWWAVRSLLWISTLAYLVLCFCAIFQCVPREKIWHPTVPGRCLDLPRSMLTTASLNVIFNCGILCIPPWGLWAIKIGRKKKMIVLAMFSVNCLALGCSIGRVVASTRILNTTDPTNAFIPEGLWAGSEIFFVIIATCFPTMPRFWQWVRGSGREPSQPQSAGPESWPKTRCRRTATPVAGREWYALDGTWSRAGNLDDRLTLGTSAFVQSGGLGQKHEGHENDRGILRTVEVEVSGMV